ncbi:serine/threonine protein kinase [Nonomuraea sp. 3-1Str]|uniref:serine/threonine-protein kinase n=1 Tax=Nonomuraea sp. 3-1Str TaxID=2929801 RepID=UPI0028670B47|nr:serine/threonine-protein kinase [Nonomuraea sp. 3-1Str]MDR8409580.1 serine/threonine protein kinase [Nonomuraea sp. 3-1Str]
MSDRKRDGRRIAGRYQLQEPIGKGGMGIVWRAYDELLDREVAVKEVRYAAALGDEVQLLNRRTMREARAAARFEHPNVIVVHDVIEEDDRPWIVMQLVESRSLGAVIKQDGPLKPRRVAEIGLAVLEALHRAHEAGVLHRDVKPENVLLADDGRVVLTDFGIATLETETQLTMTGLAGTPAFIAPERLKGLPARRESDLWSLGATLYTAVEGRSPHERGMALATMHAVLTDPPDPAPHAGPLAEVIDRLLAKEPVQRPTYEETARMLRQVSTPPVPQQPPAPAQTARMPAATAQLPVQPQAGPGSRDADPDARPRRRTGGRFSRQVPPVQPQAPVEDDMPTDPNLAVPDGPAAAPPTPTPRDRASGPGGAGSGGPGREPDLPETGVRITAASSEPEQAEEPTISSSRAEGGRRLGPVIAAAAVVVLVAGVGGYLGLSSVPDGTEDGRSTASVSEPATGPKSGDPGTGSAPATPPASTAPPASGSPSASPSETPSATTSPTPTSSPSSKASDPADALPEGWKMYKDKKLGFSVGLPKGWDVWDRGGRQVKFKGPGGASNAYLMIEEAEKPGTDPYKDWKKQEPVLKNNFGGYKKLDIKKVDFQKAAADWDFTWNTNTGKTRVRNRGFVTDNGRAYAIYWHTLKSHWKADYHFFEGFCATFKPAK